MLEGLLGRGYVSKCKSLIKPTKTRLEVLRKRAEAKQRFLKEDLAKLLANGLDINAYGRTEEFLAGLCLLSHYDFIDYTCDFIMKNLSVMQKQRECPENCREAVGSLMFAAARFSDLPELRDLRDEFQERYGSSMEHFVNQVFVDKLASRPPTKEKRLQLLRDIALEFSIKWDSHGFEKRMASPSAFVQDQNKKYGPPEVTSNNISKFSNGNGTISKLDNRDVSTKERSNSVSDGQTKRNSKVDVVSTREDMDVRSIKRQEYYENRNRPQLIMGEKGENNDISYRGRPEHYVEKYGLTQKEDITKKLESRSSSHDNIYIKQNGRMSTIPKEGGGSSKLPNSIDGWRDSPMDNKHNSQHNVVMSTKKVQVQVADRSESSSRGKSAESTYIMQNGRTITIPKEEEHDTLFRGKLEGQVNYSRLPSSIDGRIDSSVSNEHDSQRNNLISKKKVGEEEADRIKSYHNSPRPPPYVKLKDNPIPAPYLKLKDNKDNPAPAPYSKPKDSNSLVANAPFIKVDAVVNSDRNQKEEYPPQCEGNFGPTRANGHCHEKEPSYQNDIPLPKPRSSRRKQSKSSVHYDDGKLEDTGTTTKRSSSSRRKEHPRKGLQLLFDDEHHQKDEEERMMDKLLLHYSKKPSDFDVGLMRKKPHAHASRHRDSSGTKLRHGRRRDGPDANSDMVSPPARSVSLPREQTAQSEPTKVYARANSFQPDNMARHVHPKLPDYDDLAAQFAALRGQ